MMKRRTKKLILLALIIFSLGPVEEVFASPVRLNINGQMIPLGEDQGLPFKQEGRVLVPLRIVTENLGYQLKWDQVKKEVLLEKEGLLVEIATDGSNPLVNGQEMPLDVKPVLKNQLTYVPIRFIAELDKKFVDYQDGTVFISDREIYISPRPLDYQASTIKVNGRNIRANIVTIDKKDTRVRAEMVLANDRLDSDEAFKSIINRKKPAVAVNGFFFAAYDSSKETYGHIINDYQAHTIEGFSQGFFLDRTGRAHVGELSEKGISSDDISHYLTVAPFLVKDSQNLGRLGFDMSQGKGEARAQRTAIGVTKNGFIKIVTANGLTTTELADLMINIGCVEAGNLDGGASSALYYQGKYITNPGRKLNNLILFYLD